MRPEERPKVMLNGPIANRVPIKFRIGGIFARADAGAAGVEQPDGSEDAQRAQGDDERRQPQPGDQQRRRGTRQAVPTRDADRATEEARARRGSRPGWPSPASTGCEIAPTARSMPAVRMTRVWPIASAAMTAVCWKMIEIVAGCREPRIDDGENDEGNDEHHQAG